VASALLHEKDEDKTSVVYFDGSWEEQCAQLENFLVFHGEIHD